MSYEDYYNDAYRTARGNDSGWTKGASGLFLPPIARRKPQYDQPIALDFFAGCGGFSLGVKRAGFHVVGAVEWWPVAADTYLLNLGSAETHLHLGASVSPEASKTQKKIWQSLAGKTVPAWEFFPAAGTNFLGGSHPARNKNAEENEQWTLPTEHFWLANVADLTGAAILEALGLEPGDLDLVFGGPPCQGYSTAGRREVMDPRNSMVFEFARLVCELQPKMFLMENVPGMLSMVTPEGIPVIDALCHVLEQGGMGSYDALKKMLLGTSGAGAAVRQKTKEKEPKKPTAATSHDLEGQMDLFGVGA